MDKDRALKDLLYEQVARLARAVASPKRLELIELLCQAENSVDALAQQAQIRALMQGFEQTNRADLITVANVMEQARAAKRAGKTDAEIRAILQTASAAQARLVEAHKALQAQIEAVLTPEQKASGCFVKGP